MESLNAKLIKIAKKKELCAEPASNLHENSEGFVESLKAKLIKIAKK